MESRVPALYGPTITLVVTATLAVALRFLCRKLSGSRYWWDDWILVLALLFDYGLSLSYWLQAIYGGLGHHTQAHGGPINEAQVVMYYILFFPVQICYFSAAVSTKTSLILLYYRLFGVHRWFRWQLWVAWIVVICYYIVDVLVAILECKPVSFFWNKNIAGGTCINQDQFFRWNGVANLLIDFMILTLTLPVIWRLNLRARQKASLSAIFLLGTFACIASIIRVITFNQVDFSDVTYTIVSASIWSTIEQSIGIVCACLITFQPLIGWVLSTVKKTGRDSGLQSDSSRAYELSKPRSKNRTKSLGEPITSGFARLDERNEVESTVTAEPNSKFSQVPDAILKKQTIEQRYDDRV